RPFLRPATPSQRATAAPFAPVVPPPRPALGGQSPIRPAAPPPMVRKPTPIVAPAIASPAPPVSSAETFAAAPEAPPVAPPTPMPDADPFFGGVPAQSVTSDLEPLPARSRPITSEMVALDAF